MDAVLIDTTGATDISYIRYSVLSKSLTGDELSSDTTVLVMLTLSKHPEHCDYYCTVQSVKLNSNNSNTVK